MNIPLAKQVWETAYPDRRPWDQLEQSTKDEWVRVIKVTIDVYIEREDKLLKFLKERAIERDIEIDDSACIHKEYPSKHYYD